MSKKIVMLITSLLILTGCGKEVKEEKKVEEKKEETPIVEVEEKVEIIDLESNSRPYAVVVNNYPDAVKVQTGLNDAYLIYEIPVEGGMTRSLALFKDKKTEKVGTVRSARHNFLDYIMENDAIFVHFGWSIYAQNQIPQLGINNINGLYDAPFWRENPEGLATEHTAYTSLVKCAETAKNKGYRQTSEKNVPLNYSTENVEIVDGKEASSVKITYSYVHNVEFKYDAENKIYTRYVNGKKHTDYFTKEDFQAKNIIIIDISIGYADNNYYLDLKNIGTGNGYYVTNGSAKKIKWEKTSRKAQTTYKYEDGTELIINDGNTYIMLRSVDQTLNIS